MRRVGVLTLLVLVATVFFVAGCAKVRIQTIDPLTMRHTYSIAIATSFPPDETTKTVVGDMEEVMKMEVQRFTPIVSHPLYLKDPIHKIADIPQDLRDEADALFLLDEVSYTPPPRARLVIKFRVWEFASGYKGPRTITVDCDCQGMGSQEALNILAKQATRHILRGIWGPPETDLPTGLGGLVDFGREGMGGGF